MAEEDKDKINKEEENKVDENQPKDESTSNNEQTSSNAEPTEENLQSKDEVQSESESNNEEKNGHEVIHKKDGRLHIYVRQDKYKGELKSKNWVGRIYIDGKQKISSSGTPNLEEAIPILEKWFDDVHAQKENEQKNLEQTTTPEQSEQVIETTASEPSTPTEQPAPAVEKSLDPSPVNQNITSETEKKNRLRYF